MSRPLPTEKVLLRGPEGNIDMLLDTPADVRGIALICHPHPLYHGTNTNKVAHTLARVFRDLGYVAMRPNFRGVGDSEGVHDHGIGETEDMLSLISWAQSRWGLLPIALGGFSFGGFVQSRVTANLANGMTPPRHVALVGLATGLESDKKRHYDTEPIPKGISSLIIHGENDETIPLANALDWARPQQQPIVVIPGADHFFHGKLHVIREVITSTWPAL